MTDKYWSSFNPTLLPPTVKISTDKLMPNIMEAEFRLSDAVKEIDPNGRNPNEPGAKLDSGKTKVWLCVAGFSRALEEVAKVTTVGAEKYTENGWVDVPEGQKRYMEAFGRHMLALGRGEKYDNGPKGTGCMHKAQMIWNLLASLELELRNETTK